MSNMEQMQANIETFKEDRPLDEKERKVLAEIAEGGIRKQPSPVRPAIIVSATVLRELEIPSLLNLIQ